MRFDQGLPEEALEIGDTTVRLVGERVRYSLRLKREDLAKARKLTGLDLPEKVGTTSGDIVCNIACLGPDEWFVSSEDVSFVQALAKLERKVVCSVTDVSHRNVAFVLEGPEAASVLNVGCPLDLRLAAFPVGRATRTVFENAPVMIHRLGEQGFRVECWRSFGPYLRDFFVRVAAHKNAA